MATPFPLMSLPNETIHRVLTHLPDPLSLAFVARSCRRLHILFGLHRDSIIKAVLLNCVGEGCLKYATIVNQTNPPFLRTLATKMDIALKPHELDHLVSYIHIMSSPRGVDLSVHIWTLKEAIEICDFHHNVRYLVMKFINWCTETTCIDLGTSLAARPPSEEEVDRIGRTFYRFEYYRKFYGCFQWNEMEMRKWTRFYFNSFSH